MTNIVKFKPRAEPHPADDLSFMERRKPKGTGIDFWKVETSGSYGADCKRGAQLAHEYLSYVGKHPTVGNATLLGCIVGAMVERAQDGKIGGVEIGFLRKLNLAAMTTAMFAPEAPEKF